MELSEEKKKKVFEECGVCKNQNNCNTENYLDCEKYRIVEMEAITRLAESQHRI